jgi:hypothetical protein
MAIKEDCSFMENGTFKECHFNVEEAIPSQDMLCQCKCSPVSFLTNRDKRDWIRYWSVYIRKRNSRNPLSTSSFGDQFGEGMYVWCGI